jgi:hypothetical protein
MFFEDFAHFLTGRGYTQMHGKTSQAATLLLLLLLTTLTTKKIQAQFDIEDSNSTASLRGIHNVGGGVAWASGTNGAVLRTEDGGYLWQTCTIPPGAEKLDFRGIQAFDENTAIVMSSGKGDLSRLYKTNDGCQTWKLLFTNPDKEGFWDAIVMTSPNIGMLIGDPIGPSSVQVRRPVFPTYHTIDGGLSWSRNDHDRLLSQTNEKGDPTESIFAASNSAMILLPYSLLFVTGGNDGTLHDEQYTFEHIGHACATVGRCVIDDEIESALAKGDSAGGFSIAANWLLDTNSPRTDLHARIQNPKDHIVVLVGGDYKLPEERKGTASVCTPSQQASFDRFSCVAAQTPPHGYRSSVAYDPQQKLWITVGPNGTDISRDDGKIWTPLTPSGYDPPDADKNWNALSLPFVVGPHGRIGRLRTPTK